MTPERYQRLCKLFDQVQQQPPAERTAFLQQACAGDPALRAELEELLSQDEQACWEQLLQKPYRVNAKDLFASCEQPTVVSIPPAAESGDTLVGQKIGAYLVEKRIGQGGMGVVYQAEDTLLKRRVALKVLPKSAWEDPASMRRLLREAQAVARLSHPHIVPIYHVEQWEGGYFLVMEFMAGGSLQARLIQTGALPWPEATRALIDACLGLHAAHAAGFIHRDLKPANLLRDAAGLVKIADFGLVRGATLANSSMDCVAGTPPYMSPEQCRSEPIDQRSDLYALGATYFALLTDRHPYGGDTPAQVMFAHCQAPVPDPRSAVPDLPEACAAIVRKAMAKKPAERFASAAEMLVALQRLTSGGSTDAELSQCPAPAKSLASRRVVRVLAGLVLLAGIAWAAFFGWQGRHGNSDSGEDEAPTPPSSRLPPVKAFGVELPADGWALPLGGKLGALAFSPDGKLLAAGVGDRIPGGKRPGGAVVWEVATGRELCRPWPDLPLLSLAFSRDGALLMGDFGGARTYILSAGKEENWCHDIGPCRSLSFTSDGAVLALGFSAGSAQGTVKRYNWGNDEIMPILGKQSGPPVQQILFAPGEQTLAVAYGNGQVTLYPRDKPLAPVYVRSAQAGEPPVLAFAPDRPVLAVASSREVHWWNLSGGAWEDGMLSAEEEITALAYMPDGKYLAVAGWGSAVDLWSISTRRKVHIFRGHHGAVNVLACHPDGEILATGSSDGDVRIWDLRSAVAKAALGEE